VSETACSRHASVEEDERDARWLREAVSNRPKPHAACGAIEDALVERMSRSIRRLRGTGELRALNLLLDRILEHARAQA
jgi:hypothetical protein